MSAFAFHGSILALSCTLVSTLAQPVSAQLISQKSLSAAMVVTMAQTAKETCKANGYRVSMTVLDNADEVPIQLRGDGLGPRTMKISQRTAHTAHSFGVPTMPLTAIDAGGLPIKVGEEVIGAIGVSGSPAGENDEACAKTAIGKVTDQLK